MAEETLPQNAVNVLSRMLPVNKDDATAEQMHPTGVQMDFTNPDTNKTVTLFSTTGDPHSTEAFNQAMAQYEASGEKQAPKGFIALEPGTKAHTFRTAFNTVTQGAREKLLVGGERLGSALAPTGFAALAEKYGLAKPGTAQSLDKSAQQFGASEGASIADLVKNPSTAAMTGATIATTPLLGAVTKANAAGKVVMAPMVMLGNALLQGGVGGTAANLSEMALGNSPKLKDALGQFAVAGLSGGFQSVLSGLIGRYVTGPERQKEVAEGVLGLIKKSSPGMLRNPDLVDRHVGAEENLKQITSYVSSFIRGSSDDLADDFMANLGQLGKMNLTTGEKSTMRGYARSLARHSKEALDNIGDTKAINAAQKSYSEVFTDMLKLVDNSKLTTENKVALTKQITATVHQFTADATNSIEGVQVMKYLEESGAGNGWNANSFADVIRGKRTEPGSLLEKVGKQLGFNLPGGLGLGTPTATRRAEALGQAGASMAGGKAAMAAKLWSKLKGAGQPPVNTMPWQRATGSSPIPASASLYGQEAIRDFLQSED